MKDSLATELLTPFSLLKNKKSLLAFSAGVDSTALFFLLLDAAIEFDIAIVHYHRRAQANEEVAYAQKLASRYGKHCFVADAFLEETNFEANARKFRYDFFETLIHTHAYTTLLTAHQLDDRFEWMMMQFCKGAGCVELSGIQMLTTRNGYDLIRPLLEVSKERLLAYLNHHSHTYFVDESNTHTCHTRNTFRPLLAPLLSMYEQGITQSFRYLEKDRELLSSPTIKTFHEISLFQTKDETTTLRTLSTLLKERGKLLSRGEKEEIVRQKECVIANAWVVCYHPHYTLVAPFVEVSMTKSFKEECRRAHIPKRLRPYLFSAQLRVDDLSSLLSAL